MDVESDTVAGSMTEGLAEPGFGDDRSTDVVDRLGLDARGDCGDGSSLSLGDQRKDLAGDIVRRIGPPMTNERVISLRYPSTRRRRRRSEDRRPQMPDRSGEHAATRRWGPTRRSSRMPDRTHPRPAWRRRAQARAAARSCRASAASPCRRAQRRRAPLPPRCEQAPLILDTAQLPKKPGDGHELTVGKRRSPLALLIPADDVAFERNPGCTREPIGTTGNEVRGDDDGGIAACGLELRRRLCRVTAVGGQNQGLRRDNGEAVGAGEAREPTHTRQVDHDEAVELALEHGLAKPVSPALHGQPRKVTGRR